MITARNTNLSDRRILQIFIFLIIILNLLTALPANPLTKSKHFYEKLNQRFLLYPLHLLDMGEYYRAQTEWMRMEYYYQNPIRYDLNRILYARLWQSRSLLLTLDKNDKKKDTVYEDALAVLRRDYLKIDFLTDLKLKQEWRGDLAYLLLRTNRVVESQKQFHELIAGCGKLAIYSCTDIEKKYYQTGSRISNEYYQLFTEKNSIYFQAKKNRYLYGIMSALVPGSGQLFLGESKLTVLSFLTIGSLIGLGAYGWHKEQRVGPFLAFYGAFVFYVHNINMTMRTVDAQNHELAHSLADKIIIPLEKDRPWTRKLSENQ